MKRTIVLAVSTVIIILSGCALTDEIDTSLIYMEPEDFIWANEEATDEDALDQIVEFEENTADTSAEDVETKIIQEDIVDESVEDERAPGNREIIRLSVFAASASSALESWKDKTYTADNLFDNNLKTAYVEGVEGTGRGETITISFGKPVSLTEIRWYPGYQASEELLKKNGYPAGLRFSFDSGAEYISWCPDAPEIGEAVLLELAEEVGTESVTIEILNATAGSKYEDTAISEMEFWGYEE